VRLHGEDCASVGNRLPISNGIVSLQAQYGQDTSGDGAIDAWVEPDDFDPATAPGGWASISAVRLALIARNSEPDKEELEIPLTWADGTSIDLITHTDILMPAGFSWKNYRYQVYETVIPLRNIPWMEL
jgi:type IV pilus assembly protein PilW